ncbi:MAG TPA: class I SAM-dependent methyltransferase [Polyangiaceae bacterium]|nr:class I SAM-dependent methyltransferase [Polyangiaceae bacterium]
MSIDQIRETVSGLNKSASALAALGAALDARVTGKALDPSLEPLILEVVALLGIDADLAGATEAELLPLLGEIRTFALSNAKLLGRSSRSTGWAHTEPDLLQAAGDVSAAFPRALACNIAPRLTGLSERLDAPDAAFLDVGVGVGALSIEMAKRWPSLRIVGIDSWTPALALAHDNVRAAGLEARIELREQLAEELSDEDAYDLAWIPSAFVPPFAIRRVVQCVLRALRPGGWVLFPTLAAGGDPLSNALARLRTAMFGGFSSTPEGIEALLAEKGFVDVRTLPRPRTSVSATIAGRRP